MEGLIYYEDSLNPLGMPPHVYTDPERVFEPDDVEDHAMKVLEETQEEYRRAQTMAPGMRVVVRDLGPRPSSGPSGR